MAARPVGNAAERLEEMAQRRIRCELIAAHLRLLGLDVTWERVNRHWHWFTRWDEGRLPLGYLIRRTGIRQIRNERNTPRDTTMDV